MLFISEPASHKVQNLMGEAHVNAADYFVRVSVVGGGCSGLSYKMDFDNELKPNDQVFGSKGFETNKPNCRSKNSSPNRFITGAMLFRPGPVER